MRVNLLPDPSFKSGTTNYYVPVSGATLSLTEEYSYFGKTSMVVTKAALNASGVEIVQPVPVQSGLPYSFSSYARLPLILPVSEPAQIILFVEWMNSVGIILKTDSSVTLDMTDDNIWYRVGGVWTAPPGATFASMQVIQPLPGLEGARFIVDALMIEQAPYLGGYVNNIPNDVKNEVVQRALAPVPSVINGLRLGADVSLNGLILNTIDENDTIWVCTSINGWFGQTAPEMPDIPRGTEDGSYDVEGRPTARQMILSGFFIPKDPEASLSTSIDRLVTGLSLIRKGGWLMANENPSKAAWVRLSGKPQIETVNARGRTEFQIALKAGDPIKYHWNDGDPDGFSSVNFLAADQYGTAENIGTADVTGLFTFTGPVGPGTYVYNALTDDKMVLHYPLRGVGAVANVFQVEALSNFATIYTTGPSDLRPGDEISLMGMVVPFSETDETRIVTHVSDTPPYNFSVYFETDDVALTSSSGIVSLVNNDVLVVDTYNRTVTYNGEEVGHRNRLATLTDWVKFGPGDNPIEFFDDVERLEVISKRIASNAVTLVTKDIHYLIPGEFINVELPTVKRLAGKSLTSNVATLTTEEGHGYAVGDVVDIQTIQKTQIATKSRTSNVATVTTVEENGVSVGDSILIDLPTSFPPSHKQLTSNEATITSPIQHGFSDNDRVEVALPEIATITSKSLTNNVVTLGTHGPHGYSVGDNITVVMPSGAQVVKKARSGTQVVITTSPHHGYSVGDTVIVALPTNANLTGTRSIDGNATNLATFNTVAPHGFSVGDRVSLALNGSPTMLVTFRESDTTTCTLTTAAVHDFAVGEKVVISGVGSRYDGTVYLTEVTSSSITYNKGGAGEGNVASTGTLTNITFRDYYNGAAKVVESTPTATSFTVRAWSQTRDTSNGGTGGVVTNDTNIAYNGTKTIVGATLPSFAYNY